MMFARRVQMADLTETAKTILNKRYFIKGETEWKHLVDRVCSYFSKDAEEYDIFYKDLYDMNFLGNSPILMNANTDIQAYSACYVLPIEDTIESIYKFYKDAALVSKSGGGTGANYSNIRAQDSMVGSTGGVASGPISFMEVQDSSTEVIKQGSKRRGANMGVLHCTHPDIFKFVKAKDTPGVLTNFNLSVGITDEFMDSVLNKKEALGSDTDTCDAYKESVELWDELATRAWSSGEPGVIFIDTMERANPTPHLGKLHQTNPCGS